MTNLSGFWSYVREDDEVDGGRIVQLGKDIVNEVKLLTGEDFVIFIDQESIDWGQNWKKEIDNNLLSTGFFISILTPRYFLRPMCRHELTTIIQKAKELGVVGIILPVLYVDVPGWDDKESNDQLIKTLKEIQYEDWRENRFSPRDSEGYRKGVNRLANKIIKANKYSSEFHSKKDLTPKNFIADVDDSKESDENEDSLGTLDLLARAEEEMAQSPQTLQAIVKEFQNITNINKEATSKAEKSTSFAQKQAIMRGVSVSLNAPIEKIWELGATLSAQQHKVDKGYRIIFAQAALEVKEDPEAKEGFCKFFKAVRNMQENSIEAFASIRGMLNAAQRLESISREIRPGLKRLKQGLGQVLELEVLYKEWIELIDATGISCDTTEE